MDKGSRNLKISKVGKHTVKQSKFGSGYKKDSSIINVTKELVTIDDLEKASKASSDLLNPKLFLAPIEEELTSWLKLNNLPFEREGTYPVWLLLQKNNSTIKGKLEAEGCFILIETIKANLMDDSQDFRCTVSFSLQLAQRYKIWFFAINESHLSRSYTTESMTTANTKLTESMKLKAINYYRDLDSHHPITGGKITKTRKREKTGEFIEKEFGVKVGKTTLEKFLK